VLFRQKFGPTNVTTMIEPTSRFFVVLKNAGKCTKPITAQIATSAGAPALACAQTTIFDLPGPSARGVGVYVDGPTFD